LELGIEDSEVHKVNKRIDRPEGIEYPLINFTEALKKVKENSSARRGLRRAATYVKLKLFKPRLGYC
jgi:hypothetical protein